jgi:hypothetical protein
MGEGAYSGAGAGAAFGGAVGAAGRVDLLDCTTTSFDGCRLLPTAYVLQVAWTGGQAQALQAASTRLPLELHFLASSCCHAVPVC